MENILHNLLLLIQHMPNCSSVVLLQETVHVPDPIKNEAEVIDEFICDVFTSMSRHYHPGLL